MDQLKNLVSRILQIDISHINNSLSRVSCEEWDSFTHLLLISEIEKEMGVRIDFSDIERIKSYADLESVISAIQNGRG